VEYSIKKLWKEFDEKHVYCTLLLSEKIHYCVRMLDILKDDDRKSEIQLEKELLVLGMEAYHKIECLNQTNKSDFENLIVEFIKKHKSNDFEYFKKRLSETINISDKWRYSLICWFYERNTFSFLENAILTILRCVTKSLERKLFVGAIQHLNYAYNLYLMYNLNKISILNQIAKIAFHMINDVKNTEQARWMIEPVLLLFNLKDGSLDHCHTAYLISLLQREAKNFDKRNDKNYLQQRFLEISECLCDALHLEPENRDRLKRIIERQVAQAWEKSGDRELSQEEPAIAIYSYENSIKFYQKSGDITKEKQLFEKIRHASAAVQWDEEKVFVTEYCPIDLNADNEDDIIKNICNQTNMIPNISKIRQAVKYDLDKNPLLEAVSHIDFNEKNPVSKSYNKEDIIEAEVQRRIVGHIQLEELRLSLAIKNLELNGKLSPSIFVRFISDCKFLNNVQVNLIERGIIQHFNHDYISSIYVMVPQIEGILRALLSAKGLSVLKSNNKGKEATIQDNILGGLLRTARVNNCFDDNFQKYMEVKFVDETGINLRNNLLHNLISSLDEFSHTVSYSLIHVIVMLIKMY
jgi:Domain of unknown function (DUF4209)